MHAPVRQKGMISTLVAVVVLVVSLLAAMALMRSVDTSNAIATTLTFRQSALQEAERAYVDAQQKITFSEPTSDADQATLGYYASPQPATARSTGDIPNVLVNETSGSIATVSSSNGNTISYVVERLCPSAGTSSASTCIVPGATTNGGSSSNQSSDNNTFNTSPNVAFRLTVRVDGLKGTTAYVQTILR